MSMSERIELNPRLLAAAKLMGRCQTVYDVGADHGLLPLFLLQRGAAQRAVLSDISAFSLEKARRNAQKYALGHLVTFHIGDGLDELTPQEGDGVSLCGMGGILQSSLLQKAERLPCPIVLQANSERMALRQALIQKGYRIQDEEIVFDAGRYYSVIRAVPGYSPALTYAEALFGPVLIQRCDPVFLDFLRWRKRLIDKVIFGAKGNEKICLQRELSVIEAILCRQEYKK